MTSIFLCFRCNTQAKTFHSALNQLLAPVDVVLTLLDFDSSGFRLSWISTLLDFDSSGFRLFWLLTLLDSDSSGFRLFWLPTLLDSDYSVFRLFWNPTLLDSLLLASGIVGDGVCVCVRFGSDSEITDGNFAPSMASR